MARAAAQRGHGASPARQSVCPGLAGAAGGPAEGAVRLGRRMHSTARSFLLLLPPPRSRRWARPPGRGSRPRRQLLPASLRLLCRAADSVVRAQPENPLPAAARSAPARAPASPSSQASPLASVPGARAPRCPLLAPAMLSFQYPDVYRDETAVSTPARAHPAPCRPCCVCRRLQLLFLQPLAPCVPPLPLGLCLQERGRGRGALPEGQSPRWPSLSAC